MLEETSLAYEPHRIDIMADESHDPAFRALNPNGKIPAIYDPDGPSGTPPRCSNRAGDPPLSCRQDGTVYLVRSEHSLRNSRVGDVGTLRNLIGFTWRARSSASTAFFMYRGGSIAASRARGWSASCKRRRPRTLASDFRLSHRRSYASIDRFALQTQSRYARC